MRLILTILFLWAYGANAITYYVSNSGSDANLGTSPASAWRTISKVNSFIFLSGDKILFNSGDTWNEQLIPPTSNLYYGSYGSGVKPSVTALKTATGLTSSGNIWSTTATGSVANQNTVLVNGQIRAKARFPNYGYSTAVSFTSGQVVIPHTTNDYTGSELVDLSAPWVIDVTKVTQHKKGSTNDTLISDNRNGGAAGSYYFLQNKTSFLDTLNEWSIDSTTKLLSVYAESQPVVQYSIFDTLVDISHVSNIVLDGISFSGANNVTIFAGSRWDTIRNCTINNSGIAVYGNPVRGLAIINDSIQNSLSSGYWIGNDTALYVYQNYIYNSGMFEGMGGNGYSYYGGGFSYSNGGGGAIIRENTIRNTGYHGIRFVGINTFFYRNRIDSGILRKGDGGLIYTGVGLGNAYLDAGSIIRGNILSNSIGTAYNSYYAQGIYLDDGVEGILVDSNTISNINGNGVQCTGRNHTFRGNTIVNARSNNFWTNTINLTFKGNTLFNSDPAYPLFLFQSDNTTCSIDSNYYLNPASTNTLKTGSTLKDLAGWKAYYSAYDVHSTAAIPKGITSLTPELYTNPSNSTLTIPLSGGYSEARGGGYQNSVMLLPYQSVLLFPSTYRTPTPIPNLKFRTFIQL